MGIKKLLSKVTAMILAMTMTVGLLPESAFARYAEKSDYVTITDTNGNTVVADKSWEEQFPYGTFAFASDDLTVKKGGDGTITVYRLGGTIGRATAYITYIPAAAYKDEETISYANALSSDDIKIRVEDPLPNAWYQPAGKDPDPLEPSEHVQAISGRVDENGDIEIRLNIDYAESYQWYINAFGYWDIISGAVNPELLLAEEEFLDNDFRCVYVQNGEKYCSDSVHGEPYIRPEQEEYPQGEYVVDWDAPTTYTVLSMNESDKYSGYWFELVFADGEWVKEIQVSSFDNGIAGPDKFALFTIDSCDGGTVYDTANKLVLHVVDEKPPEASRIGFTVTEAVVDKAAGSAFLTVKRTGGVSNALTVDYTTSDGTAVAGRDYAAVSGTIMLYGDIDTFTIEVPLIDDGIMSYEHLDFTVSLFNLLGDSTNICQVSPDSVTVSLYNSTQKKNQIAGPNLATLLYDRQAVDASRSISEAPAAIAPVSAETVTGEQAPPLEDMGINITVESNTERYLDGGIQPMSYVFPSTVFRMTRGTGYSGWKDWTSLVGYYTSNDIDNQNSYQFGSYYEYNTKDAGTRTVDISNMKSMYSRLQMSAYFKMGYGGWGWGYQYGYPWYGVYGRTGILKNYSTWIKCNYWRVGDIFGYYYTNDQPASIDKTWGMNESVDGIGFGVTVERSWTDGSGTLEYSAISEITSARLLRRSFTNDLILKIHTANDSDTAPAGAAVMNPNINSPTYSYASILPTVGFVAGQGGVTNAGKIYVGSKLDVSFAQTGAYSYFFAENSTGASDFAVYLTHGDSYGNSNGTIKSGLKSDGKYNLEMNWSGISETNLGWYYTLNVIMTRKQNFNIDVRPSVPRKVDESGKVLSQIDESRFGEATEAFINSYNPDNPSSKGKVTFGYSQVQNNQSNPYSNTESTREIDKRTWANTINLSAENKVYFMTQLLENVHWINFNCDPEDRIVFNGKPYPGNAKIYLSVEELSYKDLNFLYYSEEYRSVPSIMNIDVIQTAIYLDRDGNSRIDGHFDRETGAFVLDRDGNGETIDELVMKTNANESFDEDMFTPLPNGGQYFMKVMYTMTPRYFEPPEGVNVDGLRAQLLPALVSSVTDPENYSRLTNEQKSIRYTMSGKNREGKYIAESGMYIISDYAYSSDNLVMIGAETTRVQTLDIPMGGDRSPVEYNESTKTASWTPEYSGNQLFNYDNPEPVYIPNSLAGENISIGGKITFDADNNHSYDTASGKNSVNGYLGSYVANTMFTMNIQVQENPITDYINSQSRPEPEAVTVVRNSAYPNTDYLKVMDGQDMENTDINMDESGNEYDEFNVDMGVKLPKMNIGFGDYVTVSLDDKEIAITVGLPLGGYSKGKDDKEGSWKGTKDTNKENFTNASDFVSNAFKYGAKLAGMMSDKSYKGARTSGNMSSGGFKADFKIMIGIILKYNSLDNTFNFYKFSAYLDVTLEYTYQYRLTPCPIVYVYVKVGLQIKVGTGFTMDRDPKEERDASGNIVTVKPVELTGGAVMASGVDIIMPKGSTITFMTNYKAFNVLFSGKINITSDIPQDLKPRSGTMASEGGKPVTVVMCQMGGNRLDTTKNIGEYPYRVTIKALEDTTISRLARVVSAESNLYWNGITIAPTIYLEAGAGIGIEILKFEVFIKIKIGCEMTLGEYIKKYDTTTGEWGGSYGPFSFDKFEFELKLGFRVVALLFNYEMDLVRYTITYEKDSGWKHSWGFLGGYFEGEESLDAASLGSFSITDPYGQTSMADVRITMPGNAVYTQQVYSPPNPYGISPMAYNPTYDDVPFQISGYGSSGDAFKLTDGLITGYDYRVISVGSDNYVVYTLSRYGTASPVDNSMLVMSRLVVTNEGIGEYGLVNPVDSNAVIPYVIVDLKDDSFGHLVDDGTGDLGFDVWVEGDDIHVAWVSYEAVSGPVPINPTRPDPIQYPVPTYLDAGTTVYMDETNYTESDFEPVAPVEVLEPAVVPEPNPISFGGITEAQYNGITDDAEKALYTLDIDTGLYFKSGDLTDYKTALSLYTKYLDDLDAYEKYRIAYGIYAPLKAAFDEWYGYYSSLGTYNDYIQNIATRSSKKTVIKTASFDTASGDNFTEAETISGPVGAHVYLPKGAGDGSTFYATANHGDGNWLETQNNNFKSYLYTRFPDDPAQGEGFNRASAMIRDYRQTYQNGLWELYGNGTTLTGIASDGTLADVYLGDGQIIDSMDVMNKGGLYYVTYITSQIIINNGGDFTTTRRLYLRTFNPDGSGAWGTPYIIRTVVDYDNDQSKSGVYSDSGLVKAYESPYFSNLGFLKGKLGELTGSEDIQIQRMALSGNDNQDFLLFEMNGTTYIIPSIQLDNIVSGTGGVLYPFFKPEDMVVGEDGGGNPITAPQTTTGRAEVTIGADGAGNISAVYVAGVEGSQSNALYLSKYDSENNIWGVGTMIAMHNMQVYEDSYHEGWTGSELEQAYLGVLPGYTSPRNKEYFTFSNIQIALGRSSDVTTAAAPYAAYSVQEPLMASTVFSANPQAQAYGDGEYMDIYAMQESGIDLYDASSGGSDTLLILTQGTLLTLSEQYDNGELYYGPRYEDNKNNVGVYVLSFGVGGQAIGEDTLTFYNYDFGIGSRLYAYLKFANTGDVAIRGSENNPIIVELRVKQPATAENGIADEALAQWFIGESIASGQNVSLEGNLVELWDTLPIGSVFYITVTEDVFYADPPFYADTLTDNGDGTYDGTLKVENKPELGFENFDVTSAGIDDNGNTILQVDFTVGNRGTKDAENVFVQFSYENGVDSNGSPVYTPLNLTGHTLEVGYQEKLVNIMMAMMDTNLVNGVFVLKDNGGDDSIKTGYGRKVSGTVLAPPSAYENSTGGALHLRVEIFSSADDTTGYYAGIIEAEHGEYNQANNVSAAQIEHKTFFRAPGRISLTLGNTMRLPISLEVTSGNKNTVLIPVETHTDPDTPRNLGVLSYVHGSNTNGHINGTLVIAPSDYGSGVIELMDVNTNSIYFITYEVDELGEGINVFSDNGYFTFYNADKTPYTNTPSIGQSQSWNFLSGIYSWGNDGSVPLRNDLAKSDGGAYFTFTTVAESIDFYFKGDLSIQKDTWASPKEISSQGGSSFVNVSFGANPDRIPYTITVTVKNAEAWVDKIIEYYTGGSPPLPNRDKNAPFIFWSRSFPDEASIESGKGNAVELICFVLDDSGLAQVTFNGNPLDVEEGILFTSFNVTVTENMTELSVTAADTAGNRSSSYTGVDWFNPVVSSNTTATAPALDVSFLLENGNPLVGYAPKGEDIYLKTKIYLPIGVALKTGGGSNPEVTQYRPDTDINENETDWIVSNPLNLHSSAPAENTYVYIMPNNAFYRVYALADDGTWAQAIVQMDHFDAETPALSMDKTDYNGSPALEWSVIKTKIDGSTIDSVSINGYDLNVTKGLRSLSGVFPITFNGLYTLYAIDEASNFKSLDYDETNIPVNLTAAGAVTATASWKYSAVNGAVAVDVSLITGGLYDLTKSNPASNQYAGSYQHMLVGEGSTLTLEDLLELPEDDGTDESGEPVWRDGSMEYDKLAPGQYTLYVRDALDKYNTLSVASEIIVITNDCVTFSTLTYPTSADGGIIEVFAEGGKDRAVAYQYAILNMGSPNDPLVPVSEMSDYGAVWENGSKPPRYDSAYMNYGGLTSGAYQIGVRAVCDVDPVVYQAYVDLVYDLSLARMAYEQAAEAAGEEAVAAAVADFAWVAGGKLEAWYSGGSESDYKDYIGNDPDIIALALAWIDAMNSGDDQTAEAAKEAHDAAVAEYARILVEEAAGQDLLNAESLLNSASQAVEAQSDIISDACDKAYADDPDLWDNATTDLAVITPLSASLLSVAGYDIIADGSPGTIASPKKATIIVPYAIAEIANNDLGVAEGATGELHENKYYLESVGVIGLVIGENHLFVRVTAEDGLLSVYYDVTVERQMPTGNPFVSPMELVIPVGGMQDFYVSLGQNEGKTNGANIVSLDPGIADTLSNSYVRVNGAVVVYGVAEGETTIRVTWTGGPSDEASQLVDVTVIPAPETDQYIVTFNGNGGTASVSYLIVDAGMAVSAMPVANRPNYVFLGWNTSPYGLGSEFTKYTVVNEDMTVYAIWAYDESKQPVETGRDQHDPEPQGESSGQGHPSGSQPPAVVTQKVNINGVGISYTVKPDGSISLTLTASEISQIIAKSDGVVRIDFSGLAGAESVILPIELIEAIAEAGYSLELSLPYGKLTFGAESMAHIPANTKGTGITITIKPVDMSTLTQAQKDALGDRPAFEVNIFDGTNYLLNTGGPVEVLLYYEPLPGEDLDALFVFYLLVNGNKEIMKNSSYNKRLGGLLFTTTHFSTFVIGYNPVAFSDINGHWARSPIVQSGAKSLVYGYPDVSFMPDANVSRAEFIQMICNALDVPVIMNSYAYDDVPADQWYYTAVAAAKLEGLLEGLIYPDGTFRPNDPITRREMAVVLANLAKAKHVKSINAFSVTRFYDYNEIGAAYTESVELAINTGFLNENGMGGGIFQPLGYVTRAQAATIQIMMLQVLGRID